MSKIRIAIAGVGNDASCLIQGLYYYKDVDESAELTHGLMHPVIGGFKPRDIVPVAAFEVDRNKVGKDLSEAIFASPNCTPKFCDVPKLDVEVMMGPIKDGLSEKMKEIVKPSDNNAVNVEKILQETRADVLVNMIPTGADDAAKYYASAAIRAGVGFVNGMPTFIASNPEFQSMAQKYLVPLIGDDVKSQIGATVLHRNLLALLWERGIKVERTYQINYSGNLDFLNLSERYYGHKSVTKQSALKAVLPYDFVADTAANTYLPSLKDEKNAHIYIEGVMFGGQPVVVEAKIKVIDSANSAGILIDAIRCCKLGKDRGVSGTLESASAYLMKHPPKQIQSDFEARKAMDEFIAGKRER